MTERTPTYFGMVTLQDSTDYTVKAIESFFKQTPLQGGDSFFLIDNDGAFHKGQLGQLSSQVIVIKNLSPQSFAQNCNVIIQRALDNKAHCVLLNNDIIFSENWFAPLEAIHDAISFPASNATIQYRTAHFELKPTMQLSEYLGKEQAFDQLVKRHHQRSHGIRIVPTHPYFCVRIPLPVLAHLGLFDEQLSIAGWEDTDYTVRAYENGIPLVVALDAYVLHFFGVSTWQHADLAKRAERIKAAELGEIKFKEKWGVVLGEIFGKQHPQLMQALRIREHQALVGLYREVVRGRGALIARERPKDQKVS